MTLNGTNITMIRGDSEAIEVDCTRDGSPSPFVSGDVVRFTVRWREDSATVSLQKEVAEFENGVAHINIVPEDTAALQPHTYCYDVEVTWADGTVKTVVGPSDFVLRGDVTRHG